MEQSAQRMIMEAKKIIGLSNSQILRLVLPPTVSIIPSWFIHCTLLSLALILFNLSVHARLANVRATRPAVPQRHYVLMTLMKNLTDP
jgi:hypothetical protein